MPLLDPALSRAEIKSVIEGKGAARRIPLAIHQWIHAEDFGSRQALYREVLDQYPSDIKTITFNIPHIFDAPCDDASYRWLNYDDPFRQVSKETGTALDAVNALDDWAKLDGVLADFPSPGYAGLITQNPPPDDGVYRLGHWWYWLFERLWSIRGMENALCDFYENGDQVRRLFRSLTDFYKVMISRGRKELGLDAVWTSDDIGMQTGPFFSENIFVEFFKPYYKELIEHAHSLGMHFWLHSCGNILPFIPHLIEIGLDVLHPIQKYTMDEREVASKFGRDICIWAGMDVQQTIPYGSPDDVRREVRFMFDTYYRKEGRLMLTAGNGMTPDTPLESLKAFLDEALNYGLKICK
ncbi:MAG: hypothetical protein LBH43_12280 [Treponema sp.]|jgi:hypothetical protein|nr:hypothetical protein [Treponema sp.]